MTEDEAYEAFKRLRWRETQGEPVCPHCDCKEVYKYEGRRIFKCKGCLTQFSATSGSGYKHRKLSYATLIELMRADSDSARALSKELKINYRTAWAHKAATNTSDAGQPRNGKQRRAVERSKEKCVRCGKSRRELSRLPSHSQVTGVLFNEAYCPKCYQLRWQYKQDEDLCAIHELTQQLKGEVRHAVKRQ